MSRLHPDDLKEVLDHISRLASQIAIDQTLSRLTSDSELQADTCLMCDHVQRICEVEQRAAAESDRADRAEARVKELESLCSNEWGENAAAYLRGISISARSHGWGLEDGTLSHWLDQQLDLASVDGDERERCRKLICNYLDIHEIDHLEGPELDATVRRILEA